MPCSPTFSSATTMMQPYWDGGCNFDFPHPRADNFYQAYLVSDYRAVEMNGGFCPFGPATQHGPAKSLAWTLQFPTIPPPKQGSGKKGGIVKQDYAEALINHVFKDKVDKAEFESMLSGIMGRKIKHLDPAGSKHHADDILRAFQGLETYINVLSNKMCICSHFLQFISSIV